MSTARTNETSLEPAAEIRLLDAEIAALQKGLAGLTHVRDDIRRVLTDELGFLPQGQMQQLVIVVLTRLVNPPISVEDAVAEFDFRRAPKSVKVTYRGQLGQYEIGSPQPGRPWACPNIDVPWSGRPEEVCEAILAVRESLAAILRSFCVHQLLARLHAQLAPVKDSPSASGAGFQYELTKLEPNWQKDIAFIERMVRENSFARLLAAVGELRLRLATLAAGRVLGPDERIALLRHPGKAHWYHDQGAAGSIPVRTSNWLADELYAAICWRMSNLRTAGFRRKNRPAVLPLAGDFAAAGWFAPDTEPGDLALRAFQSVGNDLKEIQDIIMESTAACLLLPGSKGLPDPGRLADEMLRANNGPASYKAWVKSAVDRELPASFLQWLRLAFADRLSEALPIDSLFMDHIRESRDAWCQRTIDLFRKLTLDARWPWGGWWKAALARLEAAQAGGPDDLCLAELGWMQELFRKDIRQRHPVKPRTRGFDDPGLTGGTQ